VQTGKEPQLQDKGRFEFEPRPRLDAGSITRGAHDILTVPSIDKVFCVDLGAPERWWALPGNGLIGAINSAAISPDTNWIATSYWKDRGTYVWDTRTRKRVQSLGAQGGFVTFSPDSRRLLGSAHRYTLWEIETWRPVWERSRRSAGELIGRGTFTSDGRMIALCPEVNLLQLVETETGRKIASLYSPMPKNLAHVAFSPDSQTLAVSTFDKDIQLWDLRALRQELARLNLDWQ
jgi:WD40 repeat protein